MRHIISVLLENEPGALSRVAGLFSARGYNIESLNVSATHDPSLSRMTIVTCGDERRIDQIEKQLHKLVDVANLQNITINNHLEREIVLIKGYSKDDKSEQALRQIVELFHAKLTSLSEKQFVVELSGSGEKIDEFLQAIKLRQNIIETVRSGVIGLTVSDNPLII